MEERNSKKPLIITLAVLLGIIIATVAVTLILRGRGGARFTSGDVPYPYSWQEKKNGTIALTLSTGNAANAAWELGDAGGSQIEIVTDGTKRGNTSIALRPVAEGRETVTLTLMSDGARLAEASFTVESTLTPEGSYAATITAHRERAFQAIVRGGEETGHPFTVSGGDEGLMIYVEDDVGYTDNGTAWNSQSSDGMVASVSAIDVSDEGVTIQLETRANGSAEVMVYNATRNIAYVFTVEVSGGEMLLVDSRVEPYLTDEDAEEETGEAEAAETESEAQP